MSVNKKGAFMEFKEQNDKISIIKKKVDAHLNDHDFDKIKTMIIELDEDEDFALLKDNDIALSMLDTFIISWFREKNELTPLGIESDIFDDVNSLDDLAEKYSFVSSRISLFEEDAANDTVENAIEEFIGRDISGIVLFNILKNESCKIVENTVKISLCLREKKEYIKDMFFLKMASEIYAGNKEIMTEMSYLTIEFQKQR